MDKFIPLSFLETQKNWGWNMYALYAGKKIIGYMSLSKERDDAFELHNLAVLPEYRHKGFGKLLLDNAKNVVKASGGRVIKIGIIEESTVLKNWYIANGFVHTGTKKFDHLPFTSGYLEWKKINKGELLWETVFLLYVGLSRLKVKSCLYAIRMARQKTEYCVPVDMWKKTNCPRKQ